MQGRFKRTWMFASVPLITLAGCAVATDSTGLGACTPSPSGLTHWWTGDYASSSTGVDRSSGKSANLVGITLSPSESLLTKTNAFSLTYGSSLAVPNISSTAFTDQLSVGAWVYSTNFNLISGQSLFSRGQRSNGFSSYQSFDMAPIGAATSLFGGAPISDGRYLYFHQFNTTKLFRYDSTQAFTSASSWETVDVSGISAYFLPVLSDGRYLYAAGGAAAGSGNFVIYDTTKPFTASSFVLSDMSGITGMTGLSLVPVYDGRYYYFPYNTGSATALMKYDPQATGGFTSAAAWSYSAASSMAGGLQGVGFDGRYVYVTKKGVSSIHRFDTTASFTSSSSWSSYDTSSVTGRGDLGFYGANFDGRYLYFAPADNTSTGGTHGLFIRFDTTGDFASSSSWVAFNPNTLTGLGALTWSNNRGSAFDGRYLYYLPWSNNLTSQYFLRYDTTSTSFTDTNSWNVFNSISTGSSNSNLGGHFDGRYVYSGPLRIGTSPVYTYRFDTASSNFSFDLRVNHSSNGGQEKASYLGPAFVINTTSGSYSVVSKSLLSANAWHYLAGTYDGTTLKLYVDGSLVASTAASGSLVVTSEDLKVGAIESSKSAFKGMINDLQIYTQALSSENVANIFSTGLCR